MKTEEKDIIGGRTQSLILSFNFLGSYRKNYQHNEMYDNVGIWGVAFFCQSTVGLDYRSTLRNKLCGAADCKVKSRNFYRPKNEKMCWRYFLLSVVQFVVLKSPLKDFSLNQSICIMISNCLSTNLRSNKEIFPTIFVNLKAALQWKIVKIKLQTFKP
jgi:hypothetical protein